MPEACIWSGVGIVRHETLAITQLVEMGTLTPCTSAKRNGYTIYSPNSYPISIMHSRQIQRPTCSFWDSLDICCGIAKRSSKFWLRLSLEVYKPLAQRRWGYYVPPVSTKITLIGRFDSRLNGHTWTILNWWWRRLSNQMPSCMQPRHGHPQLYAPSARPGISRSPTI